MFRRRLGQRYSSATWTGFVDVMTALLLVLIFIITAFLVIQYIFAKQVSDLTGEINQLNQENAGLSDEVSIQSEEISDLQQRLEEELVKVTNLNEKIGQLEEALADTVVQLEGLFTERRNLEKELGTTRNQLQETRLDLSTRDQEVLNLEESLSLLSQEVIQLNKTIDGLQNQLSSLNKDLARLSNEKSLAEAELQRLVQQIQDLEVSSELALAERNRLIRELSGQITMLSDQNTVLTEDLKQSLADNSALDEEKTSLLEQLSALNESLDALSKERNDLENRLSELLIQITGLNQDIEVSREQARTLETEKIALGEQIAFLEEEIGALQESLQKLTRLLGQTRQERDDISQTLQATESVRQSLNDELIRQKASLAAITEEKNELAEEAESLTAQLNARDAELAQRNSQISTLEDSSQVLRDENESLLVQLAELRRKLEDQIRQRGELERQLEEFYDRIAELGAALSTVQAERFQLQNQKTDIEGKKLELENQVIKLRSESESLINDNRDLRDNIRFLQEAVSQLNGKIDQLNEDIAQLKARHTYEKEELTNQLASSISKNEDMGRANVELSAELEQSRSSLEALRARYDQLNRAFAELQQKIEVLNSRLRQSQDENRQLATENVALESQIDNQIKASEMAVSGLQQDIARLEDEKKVLESQFNQSQNEMSTEIARLEDILRQATERIDALLESTEELGDTSVLSSVWRRLGEMLNAGDDPDVPQDGRGLLSRIDQLINVLEQVNEMEQEVNAFIQTENRPSAGLGVKLNDTLVTKVVELIKYTQELEKENSRLNDELAKLTAPDKTGLSEFHSQFMADLSQIVESLDGVKVSNDRFIFSTEVLFETGRAELSEEGKADIWQVAEQLKRLSEANIPPSTKWVLRVDGHTDNRQIKCENILDRDSCPYTDNWELSQARALSVVKYLIEELDFAPERLAATGFSSYQAVGSNETEEGRKSNRRIELKLTEP